jgi:type II secretory pathway component PulJ
MKDLLVVICIGIAIITLSALASFSEYQATSERADNAQLQETLRQNVATIGNMEVQIAVYKVQNTSNMTRIALLQELLYGTPIPPCQPPILPEPNDG